MSKKRTKAELRKIRSEIPVDGIEAEIILQALEMFIRHEYSNARPVSKIDRLIERITHEIEFKEV